MKERIVRFMLLKDIARPLPQKKMGDKTQHSGKTEDKRGVVVKDVLMEAVMDLEDLVVIKSQPIVMMVRILFCVGVMKAHL